MKDGYLEITGVSLGSIDVFAGLSAVERQEIAALCRGRRYQPEQVIVSHHDDTQEVFFIVSGTVRVTIFSLTGKEIMFRDEPAGRMFGALSAIDDKPRSAHVIAQTECLLAFISPENFWKVLLEYPSVSKATLLYMSNLIRLLSERVIEFSALGVNNRIHAELLRLAREGEREDGSAIISPAPTHAEIASRVSTHREAVTREISALGRSGLVKKSGTTIIISNLERLQEMVHDVLGDIDD